jgi:hypothetical protein
MSFSVLYIHEQRRERRGSEWRCVRTTCKEIENMSRSSCYNSPKHKIRANSIIWNSFAPILPSKRQLYDFITLFVVFNVPLLQRNPKLAGSEFQAKVTSGKSSTNLAPKTETSWRLTIKNDDHWLFQFHTNGPWALWTVLILPKLDANTITIYRIGNPTFPWQRCNNHPTPRLLPAPTKQRPGVQTWGWWVHLVRRPPFFPIHRKSLVDSPSHWHLEYSSHQPPMTGSLHVLLC